MIAPVFHAIPPTEEEHNVEATTAHVTAPGALGGLHIKAISRNCRLLGAFPS